jgi:hypothetical protein
MRRFLLAASTFATLFAAAVARGDVLPDPGRPEWDDTPMPMPDGPEGLALTVVLVAAGLALFVVFRRREARAR